MNMIASRLSLKLLVFKSLVLNMVLILKLLLIIVEPLLLILMFLKENWDMYHEPFNDTCMKNEIVINDCNTHAQTSESTISYKHVNFCGKLRPFEKNQIEE